MASESLELQSLASEILTTAYHFVIPPIDVQESGYFLLHYYLGRIAEGVHDSSEVHTPHEAAQELVSLTQNAWRIRETVPGMLEDIVSKCTELFRKSDENTRDCIETGFLEHVLEFPELRTLFQFWEDDAELQDAYARALIWGVAHEHSDSSTNSDADNDL